MPNALSLLNLLPKCCDGDRLKSDFFTLFMFCLRESICYSVTVEIRSALLVCCFIADNMKSNPRVPEKGKAHAVLCRHPVIKYNYDRRCQYQQFPRYKVIDVCLVSTARGSRSCFRIGQPSIVLQYLTKKEETRKASANSKEQILTGMNSYRVCMYLDLGHALYVPSDSLSIRICLCRHASTEQIKKCRASEFRWPVSISSMK